MCVMSEEEKQSHYEIQSELIGKKMKPFYLIHGGGWVAVLTVFLTVAGPMQHDLKDSQKRITTIESEKLQSEEAYRNFLTKGMFHIMQQDKRAADLEAIRHHENADLIYMKQNNAEAERLELVSRGSDKQFKLK